MERKSYQSLLLAIILTFAGNAYADSRNIHVDVAGTLPTLISDAEKYTIEELTLTGNLNGTDFRLIRDMAGNDYQGNLTNGKLSKLDLTDASIVSSGDYYLNTTTIHWTDNLQMVMNSPMQYSTNNNELGSYLFAGCKSLETIILPKNITAIGNDVFSHNSKLLSLEIPKNVSSISIGVIQECENLSSLSVESGNQTYSSPDGSNAIIHTANLELVAGCKNTIIPSGTKTIDPYAFQHCIRLTSIKIPESITKIGDFAFWGCYGLTELNIPASVSQIGYMAFYGCSALNSIIVDSENSVYDSRNNCNALIETSSNTLLLGCKNTIIPDGILNIGENAFRPCDGLTSIEIPASVISIGDNAFAYCYHLKSVVSNIADPSTVVMGSTVFDGISNNATLKVPQGTKDSYLATDGWKGFKDIFEIGVSSVRTVDVATAGTLSTLISNDEKFTITDLTVTGQLNGTDFRLLREMAGNDYLGKPTEGKLSKLDISGATIIDGGTYLDLNDQFIDLGNNNKLYVYPVEAKTSIANTFGDYLFAGCQQLESVKTPTSLVNIGNYVFVESGLTNINLNSGLTTLDPYAFWQSKLSSITIPNTVIHIGDKYSVDNPFAYINNLKSITLEAGNTRYEMAAQGKLLIDNTNHAVICALGNAAIPEGITWIGQNAFCNRPELVNYTIPNWVTQIGGNSFSQCVNLESVVISNQMTIITNSAFTDCTKLTSVTIPSSVTNIMYNAFGNTGLSEITIPSSVTSISGQAFAHNQNLTTVISYITNPFDIDDDVFAKGWDLNNTTYPQTLKVPSGTKALYEAATGWNKITNIEEMSAPLGKCATPEISYANGKLTFTCETDDVEFISDITSTDIKKYSSSEVELTGVYKVSVYATKSGYDNSDVTTREIVFTGNGKAIVVGDVDGDGKVNVADHVELSKIIMGQGK